MAALAFAVGALLGLSHGFDRGKHVAERRHLAALERLQGRLAGVEQGARRAALRLIQQADAAKTQAQELEDAAHQADGADGIVLDAASVQRIYSR
jgi:hypothetical protein